MRSSWRECYHESDLPKGVHSLPMGGLQHSRVATTLAPPIHNEIDPRRSSESAGWTDLACGYSLMVCLFSWRPKIGYMHMYMYTYLLGSNPRTSA